MIKELFKKVISMFSKNDIESVFGIKLDNTGDMNGAINKWLGMYTEKTELKLPAAIASETARLVTLELKSEISGSQRAEYLSEIYKGVLDSLRNITEIAVATGGVIFKPYPTEGAIAVDTVRADRFIPIAFDDDGKMSAAVFIDRKREGTKRYTRLEYHRREGGGYAVSNRAFVSESDAELGRSVSLSTVMEWSEIEPDVWLDAKEPLFVYFKMPMANTVDIDSPLGISVFEKATLLISDANEQYRRIKWEFDSSERFVGMSDDAIRHDKNGKITLPKREERLYKLFSWDADNHDLFKEWSPQIRDTAYINGLNEIYRKIEFNCGLAYGTLSDVSEQEKTAEEIKASKQRSYAHIADIQKQLQKALEALVKVLDYYATFYSLAPQGDYEMSFEWDDSIVADRKTEYQERMELASLGAIAPWELRMWYLGETEEQARAAVGAVDMTEE